MLMNMPGFFEFFFQKHVGLYRFHFSSLVARLLSVSRSDQSPLNQALKTKEKKDSLNEKSLSPQAVVYGKRFISSVLTYA